jgi:hypothetical protein
MNGVIFGRERARLKKAVDPPEVLANLSLPQNRLLNLATLLLGVHIIDVPVCPKINADLPQAFL